METMRRKKIQWMKILMAGLFIGAGTVFAEQTASKNEGLSNEARARELVKKMTLEEKVYFMTGANLDRDGTRAMNLTGVAPLSEDRPGTRTNDRLEIPQFQIAHGPYGMRAHMFTSPGKRGMQVGTYFPVSTALAATWDPAIMNQFASALGQEIRAWDMHANGGPAMNLIRDPRNGRRFEYFTEDPFLNGVLTSAYVKGLQSQQVVAIMKHFAANNQEFQRGTINVVVDERALHELYFAGFRAAVKDANPLCVMSAYNKINGTWCSENKYLLTDVLKNGWGFNGFVISDWSATHDTVGTALAGMDLEMPREKAYGPQLLAAVKSGDVPETVLDEAAVNILKVMFWAGVFDKRPIVDKSVVLCPEHLAIAQKAAEESMVLLKNERTILPLDGKQIKKLAVIGPNGDYGSHFTAESEKNGFTLLAGGGSAEVPTPQDQIVTPVQGLKKLGKEFGFEVSYAPGCYAETGFGPIPSKYLKSEKGAGWTCELFSSKKPEGQSSKTFLQSLLSLKVNKEELEAGFVQKADKDFSAAWRTKLIAPATGKYGFEVRAEGRARFYVNNKQLIDFKGERMDWGRSVTVDLNEGETADLRVEFEQVGKNRILSLFWDYENEAYLAEAKALAEKSDAVVLVGGMSGFMEREGSDLSSICLSPAQERLINEIHAIKPDAPVVIVAGGAIDMQAWIKKAPAILMAWYPGQQGGYALANILLGKVNPSGKLPVTFPVSVDQYPAGHYVQANTIEYKEGIFMGYRFFDHEEKAPQFPFGFGLSYTSFKYENLSLESTPAGVTVRAKITNTGKVTGDEVAQVYVSQPVCSVPRPVRELKGFQRVTLQPGESKTVEIYLDPRAFAFYDVKSHGWKVEESEFVVSLGSSSRDIRLTGKVTRPSAALGM